MNDLIKSLMLSLKKGYNWYVAGKDMGVETRKYLKNLSPGVKKKLEKVYNMKISQERKRKMFEKILRAERTCLND